MKEEHLDHLQEQSTLLPWNSKSLARASFLNCKVKMKMFDFSQIVLLTAFRAGNGELSGFEPILRITASKVRTAGNFPFMKIR
jgi:hypothetical protein